MILTRTIIFPGTLPLGFFSGSLRKVHCVHQSVHSAETDVNAIITFQYATNLVSAKRVIVIRINLEDVLTNLLIFAGARGRLRIKVLVICAAVYFKNPAESLDIVLMTQLMYSV